jgi:hypothetical protein
LVDVTRFWIFIPLIRWGVGWDWVMDPAGRRIPVPPGKYVRIYSTKPLRFGFEDVIEEARLRVKPDWDYDEPLCEAFEEKSWGLVENRVRVTLACENLGDWGKVLWYDDVRLGELGRNERKTFVLEYTEASPITLIVVLGGAGGMVVGPRIARALRGRIRL